MEAMYGPALEYFNCLFYFHVWLRLAKFSNYLFIPYAGVLIIFIVSTFCAVQWGLRKEATPTYIICKYRGNYSWCFEAHMQTYFGASNFVCQISNVKFQRCVNSLFISLSFLFFLFRLSFLHLKRLTAFVCSAYVCVSHSTFLSNNPLAPAPDSIWLSVQKSISFCFHVIAVTLYWAEK